MVRYAYTILRVEIHLPGRYQPVDVAWRASRVRGLIELPAVGEKAIIPAVDIAKVVPYRYEPSSL